MASDKTEQPTPKRKREARRKGQIPRSQDLTSWTTLLVALYAIPATIGRLVDVTASRLYEMPRFAVQPDGPTAVAYLGGALRDGFLAIVPLVAAVMVCSVLLSVGQTGVSLSFKPVVPDFKRVSPKQGFKRLFSIRSAWETGKQLIKILVVVVIAWPRVIDLVELLAGHGRLGLGDALPAAGAAALGLTRAVVWTVAGLSFADYGYQRYQHRRDLMMTKQEVRDEHRNAEGDGAVKGRIRAMQRSMARNRMLSDVGSADVIVTNPTHIAVALKYDLAAGGAPVVIAVGAGASAARIRERAHEAAVPMVEAKPLARALWRACDVGDEIPVALYEAVAKVLAFVRRLDRRFASAHPYELPSTSRVPDVDLDRVNRKRRRR